MKFSRRHRPILLLIVLIALLGAPIARMFCSTLAAAGVAAAVEADHRRCAPDDPGGGPPVHKKQSECPVCLAFSAVIPNISSSLAPLPPPALTIKASSVSSPSPPKVFPAGGLGSRAPPIPV